MIDREALALQLPLRKELRAELREQRLRDYLQFLKEHVPLYKNSQAYDANYDLPGGDGPVMASFIIVRNDAVVRSLAELRGLRAANNHESSSGSNFFRAEIAALAGGGHFFSEVIETSGHGASIAAVTSGKADVAVIDCVTYGNIGRFAPERQASVRILGKTTSGPCLPFVTPSSVSDGEAGQLRDALQAAIGEPSLASVRESLSDFVALSDIDYEPLLEQERKAVAPGYPRIA